MNGALHPGAARRTINPPLGIGKTGGRLFGEPATRMARWPTCRGPRTSRTAGRLGESYALPDQLPQFYPLQVIALHPDSEQRALDATVALIRQLTG